jgi:hypothetical protein
MQKSPSADILTVTGSCFPNTSAWLGTSQKVAKTGEGALNSTIPLKIWILVNNIEIRLVADDKVKDFKTTDKLQKFIEAFDLAGLEKL